MTSALTCSGDRTGPPLLEAVVIAMVELLGNACDTRDYGMCFTRLQACVCTHQGVRCDAPGERASRARSRALRPSLGLVSADRGRPRRRLRLLLGPCARGQTFDWPLARRWSVGNPAQIWLFGEQRAGGLGDTVGHDIGELLIEEFIGTVPRQQVVAVDEAGRFGRCCDNGAMVRAQPCRGDADLFLAVTQPRSETVVFFPQFCQGLAGARVECRVVDVVGLLGCRRVVGCGHRGYTSRLGQLRCLTERVLKWTNVIRLPSSGAG